MRKARSVGPSGIIKGNLLLPCGCCSLEKVRCRGRNPYDGWIKSPGRLSAFKGIAVVPPENRDLSSIKRIAVMENNRWLFVTDTLTIPGEG
jgi:hypothetical protein